MIRFNRLAPLFNALVTTIPTKINKNVGTRRTNVNIFANKLNSHVRYISVTPKLYVKDIVEFDEFKQLTKDKSTIVIDVREPEELKETGVIPGSINVPCKQLGIKLLTFLIIKYFYSRGSGRCFEKVEQGGV